MPSIKIVTNYVVEGRAFPSWEKAIDYLENKLETYIRSLPGIYQISPKERHALIEKILRERETLIELLSIPRTEPDSIDE